jgi:hypothetical protein
MRNFNGNAHEFREISDPLDRKARAAADRGS